ncbi:MAG TPA: nitroreductase family protein [Dictyobacter sp.]|jgi:nitroreductase|nr:nitroreductase family protein [Dictyobacter sp.]
MSDKQAVQEYIQFLRQLRAVRSFRSEPLSKEILGALLEVARWSGSANNVQPWEFIVVQERKTLHALAQAEGFVKHLESAAAAIVLVMAGEADQVAQETYDEGRLSERIMLAASAYGVGSCIGWFYNSGPATAKSVLGLPEGRLVRTVISLGYPDEEALSKPKNAQARKALDTIVRYEHY